MEYSIEDISNWLRMFYHLYQIYLYIYENDGIEDWVMDMIYNPDSDLNKTGIKLAKEMSIILNKKVYYYLYTKGLGDSILCPFCKNELDGVDGNYNCVECEKKKRLKRIK